MYMPRPPVALAVVFLALSPGCSGLRLNTIDAAYRKPSNVAVFFTVEDRNDVPVAGMTADQFKIYEDGKLISLYESNQTIVNPEIAAEHYTLLLVDMSASITESDTVPFIVQAASEFTAQLEQYHKVAVFAFDGSKEIHKIQDFTASAGASRRGVTALASFQPRDPSTNLHGAMVEATKHLNEAVEKAKTPLRFGTLVVFTDGTDRAARVSNSDMMQALSESNVDVFAIGVGSEIDEKTLSGLGRNGYARASDAESIINAFAAVTDRILHWTQSHYLLSYCSPSRSGTHEVTIEAATEANGSGKLKYSFDANGFGPRCDPNSPPPFDTSGKRGFKNRGRQQRTGIKLEIKASASAQ
jgi:von Willebrand factor type A domain